MNSNNVPVGVVNFVDGVTREIFNPILGVIFALALVYFIYGLMTFIFSADNQQGRIAGKQHMVWGTVGMVIMVSVFGIIQLMLATFGVGGNDLPNQLPLGNITEDF